jgi:hypothetical protein
MTERMQQFLSALEAELPLGYVVHVRPYSLEEDEEIHWFIHILMVPSEELHPVAWRAWTLAGEIYGDEPTPFLMTSVNPESSTRHFPEALAKAGRSSQVRIPTNPLPMCSKAERALPWRPIAVAATSSEPQPEPPAKRSSWITLRPGPAEDARRKITLDRSLKSATTRREALGEPEYPYAA